MAIDLDAEELVPLSIATKFFPRRSKGKRRHVASLYRYTTTGCRGVVLESVQCATVRCTTREAVLRFFAALTEAAKLRPVNSTIADRQRLAQLDQRADAAGI